MSGDELKGVLTTRPRKFNSRNGYSGISAKLREDGGGEIWSVTVWRGRDDRPFETLLCCRKGSFVTLRGQIKSMSKNYFTAYEVRA